MSRSIADRIRNRLYRAVVPYKKRRSDRVYRETSRLIASTENLTEEQQGAYHLAKIKEMVEYCRVHVPYYRDEFKSLSFSEDMISSLDDVRRIPLLRKSDLKENLDRLVSNDSSINENRKYSTTGGTTGEPVGFYSYAKRLQSIENAFVDNVWSQAEYEPGDCIAVMRGTFITEPAKDGYYWRKYQGDPHLYLSIFHMEQRDALKYVELMKRFKVRFLHCFPSSARTFYKLLGKAGGVAPSLKGIFTSSELLTESDREYIQRVSKTSIVDLYGASERVVFAGECLKCGQFHVYPQYGYFELVDEDGGPVKNHGEPGNVIGSSYNRLATPLLRYEVGDLAVSEPTIGLCGRHYPSLSRILGRQVDYAVSESGREVSMSMMNMHTKEFDSIIRFQFYQDTPGQIEFHYSLGEPINEKTLERMKAFVAEKLGEGFHLSMVEKKEIPRGKNGKHKLIVHGK